MESRKLTRQLSLVQVVMLGSAGAIGGQIFVLTGHAAGIAGPALVLALIIGGLLSFSIAFNYAELASSFPVTGGAMTYVREAWGRNLLFYLVGSLDCLSSTFFAALSAIGFSYSIHIFLPILPIIPTAIGITLIFIVLNILGVSNVGNVQVILGGVLLLILGSYVIAGFVLEGGFSWETFIPGGRFFPYTDLGGNVFALLSTIALVYVAYIGFEVIADDAEEVRNPDRNIPRGILISLCICLVIYPLLTLTTLGTIPWYQLAGSESALSDVAGKMLPNVGTIVIGIAGIIASTTTLNSAMLSATREAFTMSRDGMWPKILSNLSRFRTPHIATILIGSIICAVSAIGLVDFLSYISSSGYLFVLFFSNLALLRLRKRYPQMRRPYKAPFFPVTVYVAMATCVLIIFFADRQALLFGACLLGFLAAVYYLTPIIRNWYGMRASLMARAKTRILVPVANPRTGGFLTSLATILAQASEDATVCIFHVNTEQPRELGEPRISGTKMPLLLPEKILHEIPKKGIPLYSKIVQGIRPVDGIIQEIDSESNVKMVITGWPESMLTSEATENPVKTLLEHAQTNVLVLQQKKPIKYQRILVPIGGGIHSRLALRIAYEIAEQNNGEVTVLHTMDPETERDHLEDEENFLKEIIGEELGSLPLRVSMRVASAASIAEGVMDELTRVHYDLLVMGASEEWGTGDSIFGAVDDWIAAQVKDSAFLLVRLYETAAIHWMRQRIKFIEKRLSWHASK